MHLVRCPAHPPRIHRLRHHAFLSWHHYKWAIDKLTHCPGSSRQQMNCYQPSRTSWIVRTETSESVDLISRLVTPTKILCRIQDVPGQEEVVMCQICRIIEGLALRWYCAEGEPRLQLQVASRRFGIVPPCLRRFGHVVLGRVVASDKWA